MEYNPVVLWHVSEEAGIERFDPRPSQFTDEPVVWAVHDLRLHNYLLPRDCPRVTFYAGDDTSAADIDRFLGRSHAVIAFESVWLDRVRAMRLYCYHLPEPEFSCTDQCAGYHICHSSVEPAHVEIVHDLLAAIASRGVEIRIVPTLWPLRDAVVSSTLKYSVIRIRNAQPRCV